MILVHRLRVVLANSFPVVVTFSSRKLVSSESSGDSGGGSSVGDDDGAEAVLPWGMTCNAV